MQGVRVRYKAELPPFISIDICPTPVVQSYWAWKHEKIKLMIRSREREEDNDENEEYDKIK